MDERIEKLARKGAIYLGALSFVVTFVLLCFASGVFAEELPGSSFATAPISKAVLIPNEKLVLTYAPEKLDPGKLESTFSDISQLVEIRKSAEIGNADFAIYVCRDETKLEEVCEKLGKEIGTCEKLAQKYVTAEVCEKADSGKSVTVKSGERLKIEPVNIQYESTPQYPNGYYRVWEDLFVAGQKIEGATWWEGRALTRYLAIATSASTSLATQYYFNQTVTGADFSDDFVLFAISYKEGSDGTAAGNAYAVVRDLANHSAIGTSESYAYANSGAAKNFTFTNGVGISQSNNYNISVLGPGFPNVWGCTAASGTYSGGAAQRAEGGWSNYDCWMEFWGLPYDTIAPEIDACNPANGSTVGIGVTQFRINATDETGLFALNHTDSFTGTTAYNFTPFNGSAWYVDVDFNTSGTYWWDAWANDTFGNSVTTGNCSLEVTDVSSTTTTAPSNATVTTVNVNIPGLGWGIFFFMILVTFVILGGLGTRKQ